MEANGEEAQRALRVVRTFGEEGVQRIIGALGEEEQMGRRMRLIQALKELGDLSLEPLKRTLLDPRWYLVRNAVNVLGEIGEPRVVSSLVGLLSHPEVRVRKEVVQALGNVPTPKAEEGVFKALDDNNEGVRARAIEVLQTMGGDRALNKIRQIAFSSGTKGAKTLTLRLRALRALASLGDEIDAVKMEDIFSRRKLFSRMGGEEVRRTAVAALGGILERTNADRVRGMLGKVARSDPSVEVRKLAEEVISASA
jgi:HEAT repeat protein